MKGFELSSFFARAILVAAVLTARADEPVRLHPDNPRYLLWRGAPAVLITAGEHYGAVMNLDFDYARYLDVLKSNRFNLTRVFSGTYREVSGSFNITGNTLAPARGRYVCPWARSETPSVVDGKGKFDLTRWDTTYFDRLKDFLTLAGRRGVVAELVLFCTMYDENVWNASPMNARNNVNGIGKVPRSELYSGHDKALLAIQNALVAKLVTELNHFDNLYFEVCNEPYERGGLTKEWNDLIIAAITDTEAMLPKKHLIAQGFPPSSAPVPGLNRHVSILNFHGAKADAVQLNHSLNRVIALDETGGTDRSDLKYRTEAWKWILAGGAIYDHLDFSFTTDHPDGSARPFAIRHSRRRRAGIAPPASGSERIHGELRLRPDEAGRRDHQRQRCYPPEARRAANAGDRARSFRTWPGVRSLRRRGSVRRAGHGIARRPIQGRMD